MKVVSSLLPPDWSGTAAQLAEALAELLARYALNPEPTPSERLVRFYVTSGVLQKPQREGREALFGPRQALEFLAARALLEDGWPLAKVAEFLPGQSDDDLEALLPEREPRKLGKTKAQELVEQLRVRSSLPAPAPNPVLLPNPVQLKQRQRVREAQQKLESEGVKREAWVHLTVTPWCEVELQQAALESVTLEQVESAVELIRAALVGELARKGRLQR